MGIEPIRAHPPSIPPLQGGKSRSSEQGSLQLVTPAYPNQGGRFMLLTIAIILLILWALGFFAFHVAGGLIHILLVIGIIVLIWNFVAGRRAV
jgi:hypothetical protein